jgi:hypothetical protein
MPTLQDQDLRDRLGRVRDALEDPKAVSGRAGFRVAIEEAREHVDRAWDSHQAAVGAMDDAQPEPKSIARAFDAAVIAAAKEYAWLAGHLRHKLIELRPSAAKRLGKEALGERERFLAEAFPVAPSTLPELKDVAVNAAIAACAKAIVSRPDLVTAEEREDALAAAEKVAEAYKSFVPEPFDEGPLLDGLRAARAAASAALLGTRALLEGILLLDGSGVSVDTLVERAGDARREGIT